DKLISEEIDTYLTARRALLALGPACRALITDGGRRLPADAEKRLQFRFTALLSDLDMHAALEQRIRAAEAGLRRAADLAKDRQRNPGSQIALLLSRAVSDQSGHAREDPYSNMCYFSFPKARNGYDGAVSLEFGNGGDVFDTHMYGDPENRIK